MLLLAFVDSESDIADTVIVYFSDDYLNSIAAYWEELP